MTDWLRYGFGFVLSLLVWSFGYYTGKKAGIREARRVVRKICQWYEEAFLEAMAENHRLCDAVDYLYDFARTYGVSADDLREIEIEVDLMLGVRKACRELSKLLLEIQQENDRLKAENAKLREMLAEDNEELAKIWRVIDYLYSFAKTCGVDAEDMRELGIEVNE